MPKAVALVLSSGGLRSLVCAALAAREFRVALLHLNDHRTTATPMQKAFELQVAALKPVKSWILDADFLRQTSLPLESTGLVNTTSSDATAPLIPFREIQMLAVASGFARQIKATAVFWGAHFDPKASDALARNIELVQVFNQLLQVSSGGVGNETSLLVRTPLMGLEDHQVIELGHQIAAPFQASWSCQIALEKPCMSCPACARRIRAFRGAQLPDPLVVPPTTR